MYKVKLIHNFHKNASDFSQQPIIFYSSQVKFKQEKVSRL
ncbi:hypothetical protein J969_4298, partial [Acinetobacter baumannii 26016_3]